MPLPRFHRLPSERRDALLAAARAELARPEGAGSYTAIIARAGISKTCAYLYFDGKDDVVRAVKEDLDARLRSVVGGWVPAPTRPAFFEQLALASARLHRHLTAHGEDLHLVSSLTSLDAALSDWFEALVRDGLRLGLIRADVPFELMLASTRAVIGAVDRWSIDRMLRRQEVDPCEAAEILKGLWMTPNKEARAR